MSATRTRRLMSDIKEFSKIDPTCNICLLEFDEEHSAYVKVAVGGPRGSASEGGTFEIQMRIPGAYPFSAPRVHFTCPVFHPNVDTDGKVCISLLSPWSPGTTLVELVEAVQALLDLPNPDSPLNAIAAVMVEDDLQLYQDTVVMFTAVHAGGPNRPPRLQELLAQLMEIMHFDEGKALGRLASNNWDMETVLSLPRYI